MSELSFELRRSANTVTSREQRHVAFWRGTVGQLGTVELVVPALEVVPVGDRDTNAAAVTGESVPPSSFTGLAYGGRPRLARGRLQVAGQEAALSRNAWRTSRGGRALRIRVVGREYRYQERGNRRHHVLERAGAQVETARSSASVASETLRGTAGGAVDSVDLSLAILLEGVYTRNLSLRGALISAPGRLLDRLGG